MSPSSPDTPALSPSTGPGRPSLWLLGADKHRRTRTSMTLLSLAANIVFAAMQHLEVVLGLIDRDESNALTLFNLSGVLAFYLLVRTGLSLRLWTDQQLTLVQSAWGMVAVCWSYAITGPARGAILSIMILVILFGMFALRPGQARMLTLGGFAGIAAVMAWRSLGPGARYEPRVELMHFIFAAITMLATASLSVRLGKLRARLSAQKAELSQALEINRQLATRDMLTGLLNRRAMTELLSQEQPRQQRARGPMALAVLDLDHFKRINDGLGHQAGDAVLQRFAELMRGQLRAGDALARWGGEEFLLLLPGTTVAEAQTVVNRLRQRVADEPFDGAAPGLRVTFSAGLAACAAEEAYDHAIERADRALYRAKELGRNRAEVAA